MPSPDAREPLEPLRSPDVPARTAIDGPGGSTGDLAAVPAFLRGRRAALARPPGRGTEAGPEPAVVPDVGALPMLGVAPRRLTLIGAAILLAWMVISFGRQVAEASASSARAEELRAANAALAAEVTALERELQVIGDQRYIGQAARAFRLGNPDEIPFALEAEAPPLADDAPGSAALRLGAEKSATSPLERWLDVLFGPGG